MYFTWGRHCLNVIKEADVRKKKQLWHKKPQNEI